MSYNDYLKKLENALESAEQLEREFDRAQANINSYKKLQKKSSKNFDFEFSENKYNEAIKKNEEGDYADAADIAELGSQELEKCYDSFDLIKKSFKKINDLQIKNVPDMDDIKKKMNEFMLNEDFDSSYNLGMETDNLFEENLKNYADAENLIADLNEAIEIAKEHILIESFVPKQESAEQNFEERNLKETIDIATEGIGEVAKALRSWIPKIKIDLPNDLVATESNRAAILVENIGKTKITSVKLAIDGLEATGKLTTGELEPGMSTEIIVGLIPSTPGNLPVTITSTIVKSFESVETVNEEEIWVEILRSGGESSGPVKSKKKVEKKIKEDIKPEWTVPDNLSEEEEIVGDFFNKRWESYRTYPDNKVVLDYLHNNREKYAISSYFEIPTDPKKVMEDWALPHNLRGNIHLDSKRENIVRDLFESPYDKNYVIIGEPGVGKTVLLFEIFDKLMKKEPVGVLTNENIGNAHEQYNIRLFYDDISEKPDLYEAIAAKENINGLVLSSREAEWSELPVDFRKKFTRLTVPRFSDEEMEALILKTLDVNVILHDAKALKILVKYSQGSPIYVGSLIKEMIYNGIRRLSETYLKENAQKGMEGYVIMILQRLLKSGNDYRDGGLHTLSCLMFLANHVEERKCHEQLLRAFANEIDIHMEEKFNDIYDRRTFNRSIDYLSGQGSLVRFPHDTWVDILQGQGASNPFRSDIQEIRKEFEDTGMFEKLKKDAIDDAWESIQKRYQRNNVREKDSFLELCDTLTSNFRLSDLKEMGVDIGMVREVASKHRDEPIAASILSRLEGAEPTHNVINIQDSVINRSSIGSKGDTEIKDNVIQKE